MDRRSLDPAELETRIQASRPRQPLALRPHPDFWSAILAE